MGRERPRPLPPVAAPRLRLARAAQRVARLHRNDSHGFDPEPLFRTTTLFGERGASKASQFAGPVRIHPSGRFVYVANRTLGVYEQDGRPMLAQDGDDIAVFEIDAQSGRPTPRQRIDSEGVMPRTVCMDPAGELLVVANQFTVEGFDDDVERTIPQSLMLYHIARDGQLSRAGRHALELWRKPMICMDVLPDSVPRR